MMINFINILRPHHWVKNLLIFIPMLVAHQINDLTLINSILAFISFSLIASSGYILNDFIDINADKFHPVKKKRSLASGKITKPQSILLIVLTSLLAILISTKVNLNFTFVIAIYFLIVIIYSIYLKKIIILDIIVLSCFYTIRIYAGSEATEIFISVWLFMFSIFFFLSLAAVKRQIELVLTSNIKKKKIKGRGYTIFNLPVVTTIAICSGYISIIIFAFYINSPETKILYPNPSFLWGSCFVLLYWITRIVVLASKGLIDHDPVLYAAKDKMSYICLFITLLFITAGILL